MKRTMIVLALSAFIAAALALPASGQLVVSGGGTAYLGAVGLMPGGGVQVEDWLSVSEDHASSGLMLGLGLEYIALTTQYTRTPGSGWILPFTLKYGFIVGKNLVLGLGAGAAVVLNDTDLVDSSGYYYATSVVGGAPFANGSLYLFVSPHLNLQFTLRAGALFNEAGTVPFLGAQVLLGYYIELPRPSPAPESDDESDY